MKNNGFKAACIHAFAILVLQVSSVESTAQDEEFVMMGDLQLLTAIIPHYKVEKATLEEALEVLVELAIPNEDERSLVVRIPTENGKAVERLGHITLELDNTDTSTLIKYIAELSGCTATLTGWRGVPILEFHEIKILDDSSLCHTSAAYECPQEVALALGFKEGMTIQQVQKELEKFGVSFPKDSAAYWNSKTGWLAIRNFPTVNTHIGTVIKLLKDGWVLQKKSSIPKTPEEK